MLIQIILVIFSLFVLAKVSLRFRERKISLKEFIFWIVFWLAVMLVVILPETTTLAANLVGVGRGSDLAVYLSVVVLFYLVFRIFVKLDNIDAAITKVVRKEALEEVEKDKSSFASSSVSFAAEASKDRKALEDRSAYTKASEDREKNRK